MDSQLPLVEAQLPSVEAQLPSVEAQLPSVEAQLPSVECPICMDCVEVNKNCTTTECGHCFHTSCLMKSVAHNGFGCPYCRTVMAEEPEDSDDDEDDDDRRDNNSDEDQEYLAIRNAEDTEDQTHRAFRFFIRRVEEDDVLLSDDEEEENYYDQYNANDESDDESDDESFDEETENQTHRAFRFFINRIEGDDVILNEDDDEEDKFSGPIDGSIYTRHVNDVVGVPSAKFVANSLIEQGITFERVVDLILRRDHSDYYAAHEIVEDFDNQLFGKMCQIVRQYRTNPILPPRPNYYTIPNPYTNSNPTPQPQQPSQPQPQVDFDAQPKTSRIQTPYRMRIHI